MFFYDLIDKDTIAHEMDRICGTTNKKFPFQEKAARLNSALDAYFNLAWKYNGVRLLDDINHSAIPLEETNIVSGTNAYKMGDFTKKIQQILNVVVLDGDANPITMIPETFEELESDTFENLYVGGVVSGTPKYYCIYGDYIYLRPDPNYSETSGLQVYGNVPSSKFDYNRFTVTIAAPGVVTLVAHGLALKDTVLLATTGALPTGLVADTLYYVVATVATDTFSLALTEGGTAITTSVSQSGEHSLVQANKIPGIPAINDHYLYLARKASLPYLVDKKLPQKNDYASLVNDFEDNAMAEYFGKKNRDLGNRVTKAGINYR